jgi:lysozyme family protein
MTARNFDDALRLVLAHEGGYVNHPADPGGETNFGVTKAVYDAYRARKNLKARSVKAITKAESAEIYRAQYWDAVRGDQLPAGVDYAVFDYAVNSGPGRAVKDLQRALGCMVDGVVGVATLAAVADADDARLIGDLCDRRLAFLKKLRTWKTFGKGWGRRVSGVRQAALGMVRGDDVVSFISAPLMGAKPAAKGREADQAQLKTADGAGLSTATAGGLGQTAIERAQEVQPHIGDTVLGRAAIAVCVLLMAFGFCLLAWAQIRRIKEAGGLGGYLGSVFK